MDHPIKSIPINDGIGCVHAIDRQIAGDVEIACGSRILLCAGNTQRKGTLWKQDGIITW